MSVHSSSGSSSPTFTKPKLPFAWPSYILTNPIPRRYRRRLRSKLHARQSPASALSSIETSFSPYVTLHKLQKRRWNLYDAQNIFLVIILLFSAAITPSAPIIKAGIILLALIAAIIPITSQFLIPALPVLTWVIFFFAARFIPSEARPGIWVRVLPALENILYGANLSNILSAHQHVVLDVLAWFPYGIVHFGGPAVAAVIFFIFAAPGTLPIYGRSFGYVNLTGVIIQVLLPCAAPWYENRHGLAPANYGMPGSPAGLARIDALFGVDLYSTNFTNAPVVFGAFPSLHAGNAVIVTLFMSYCFPRFKPFFAFYVMWLWWATMYLSHHYAVDLVAGSMISGVVFYIARANFLPRRQADKSTRWDYDYVEIGEVAGGEQEYDLAELGYRQRLLVDEWAVGGVSSEESGSASPDDGGSLWEGETLGGRESTDRESVAEIVLVR
ncbi:hypothetical protein V501_09520 [Pseudogymnoascus sp. VKM F-4519 (FW-2642)]|nr:hypothetical protein V501_09520 [Pseudogymnoascus sp. VKM F-4519 (FW-2642)]